MCCWSLGSSLLIFFSLDFWKKNWMKKNVFIMAAPTWEDINHETLYEMKFWLKSSMFYIKFIRYQTHFNLYQHDYTYFTKGALSNDTKSRDLNTVTVNLLLKLVFSNIIVGEIIITDHHDAGHTFIWYNRLIALSIWFLWQQQLLYVLWYPWNGLLQYDFEIPFFLFFTLSWGSLLVSVFVSFISFFAAEVWYEQYIVTM